jgi:hypothetical protein
MFVEPKNHPPPLGATLARGFAAAHGALVGALCLFLLHAPLQALGAVTQGFQREAMPGPRQAPDSGQVLLSLFLSCGILALSLAVFFLFPLVQGGILGQVRDRLESPQQPPGRFGAYGRAHYLRLLGSQGLFTLVMVGIMLPVMCLGMSLAFQEVAKAGPDVPPNTQQLTRQLLMHPVLLGGMVTASLLASAVAMVYWVANCVAVAEQQRVMASWRKALHFCRQNFPAVLAVWLLSFAVGVLISPLSLVGQLGIVTDLWALVALALAYAAFIAYWGLLLAGLSMALYLSRRHPAEAPEPALAALA